MGTRNLTMVIHNQKTVVAQYGQWDGYPSGQGLTALEFLHSFNKGKFIQKLNHCRFITEEEYEKHLVDTIGSTKEWVSMEEADKLKKAQPQLDRDMAAEVLNFIYNSNSVVLLQDNSGFAADSLFCEWAYVIDLDNDTFEVYEGFNKQPLEDGQRFKELQSSKGEYYPVRCIKTYQLSELPDKDTFLKQMEELEKVEED